MDLKALLNTLLSEESVNGVGGRINASPAEVRSVLGNALPLLLNGANDQAVNTETASGFTGALQQHAQSDTSNLSSFFGNVDTVDGAKIVAHLLGLNSNNQTQSLAQSSGVSILKTIDILSVVAPLLMSLIGQQTSSENNSGLSTAGLMGNLLGSGDMASLIGSLLGGAEASEETQLQEAAVLPTNKKKNSMFAKILGMFR